jgi:cyclophilin family peptidyl-prolyl cis-trans isomerase
VRPVAPPPPPPLAPPQPPPPPAPLRPPAPTRHGKRAPEIFSAPRRRRGKLIVALTVLVVTAGGGAFAWSSFGADGGLSAGGGVVCREATPVASSRAKPEPDLVLEPGVDYRAVIATSCGDIHVDLLETQAPRAVANFVHLAERGFYDGLPWHLVARDFMIQSGNPNGEHGVAPDDAGYLIEVETPEDSSVYRFGALAFWTEAAGAAGSQFFVVAKDADGARAGVGEALPVRPLYGVFGQVEPSSFDVVETIAALPTARGEGIDAYRPLEPAVIERVEIIEGS